MITFKNYSELTPEQISFMAEMDCGIPATYVPSFVVNEKIILDRIKYYEELVASGFIKMAFDAEKLVGFHALKLVNDETVHFAHIGTFWIRVDYRRMGIGKQLKELGEVWARENKCEYIRTGVNLANKRMIEINEKAGYEVFSQIMHKKL